MKEMISMLFAVLLLTVVIAGCGGQETPKEDMRALGIGRASFWSFYDDGLSPLGLDECFFTIFTENMTAGSESLEIRRQDNSIPVDEFEYTQITYAHSDGETEPAT